ncbi:MAG: hypothetical protein M1818_003633 [Claussenomyces sp. TS43310]|nr:MAG: hypothetical protein M1818_003633 [Claussenomyces sp. TS43310]
MAQILRARKSAILGLALFYMWCFYAKELLLMRVSFSAPGIDSKCTNDTLGIVVVSKGPSARVDGLRRAAEFTSIALDIPLQPQWSTKEVDDFRGIGLNESQTDIGTGQAQCWMGHLNVLREMIQREWSTVLILEDDADWDIAIKYQLSLLAPLIIEVARHRIPQSSDGSDSPYGDIWDLLWIGHCGDVIPKTGVLSVFDETLPESSKYRENNGQFIDFPPQVRMVHITDRPICTYAYAVTAKTAKLIYGKARRGMRRIITAEIRQ